MIKNSLWGTLGIAIPLITLTLIRRQTGWPPALPFGWPAVWLGGFIILILVIRLMDAVLKDLFARRPELERFATGVLIGCWVFAGIYLHS
ncbi:MAG: hypothetical protein GIW97_08570 [Candidatus Eremiobacteraeota bacterium]|nr:hypothetical protein [Candidatus Eremiobacteraeota bacterium]